MQLASKVDCAAQDAVLSDKTVKQEYAVAAFFPPLGL